MSPENQQDPKLNITLLKQLVSELENQLNKAEKVLVAGENKKTNDYVVEMSKVAGLCSGIAQEAALLTLDISTLVNGTNVLALEKLIGGSGGGGGATGGGSKLPPKQGSNMN